MFGPLIVARLPRYTSSFRNGDGERHLGATVSQRRLKKSKRLKRTRPLVGESNSKTNEGSTERSKLRVQAGFPHFWQTSYDAYPQFFSAAVNLMKTANQFLDEPVKGRLCRVLRFMLGAVSNSLGAVMTPALNGYGHDAVRIARSMFETAVNAEYIRRDPCELNDFLDFHWIRLRQTVDYYRQYAPTEVTAASKDRIDEIDSEYSKVKDRFTDGRKKPRGSWCKRNLRQRCEAIEVAELYPMFYQHASDFEHGNVRSLAQQSTETLGIGSAPSLKSLDVALKCAHLSAVYMLGAFHAAAQLERNVALNEAFEAVKSDCDRTWKDAKG